MNIDGHGVVRTYKQKLQPLRLKWQTINKIFTYIVSSKLLLHVKILVVPYKSAMV